MQLFRSLPLHSGPSPFKGEVRRGMGVFWHLEGEGVLQRKIDANQIKSSVYLLLPPFT